MFSFITIVFTQDVWVGVLHHVHNEHEWALSYGSLAPGSCFHGDLEETERDKKWLDKGSSAHAALTKVVLDKRFLNNVHYFLNFRYIHVLQKCTAFFILASHFQVT